MTSPIALKPISASEEQALIWLGGRLEMEPGDTIESTGLAQAARRAHVVNSEKTFTVLISRLRHRGLVETVRMKHVALYSLTAEGKAKYTQLLERGNSKMVTKSIEEQLADQGVTRTNYTAPTGVTLPRKGEYSEDEKGLIRLYSDRINGRPTINEKERISEWYGKLKADNRPAFEWIQEAICRTSTKVKSEQRTIGYMIGILKSWSTYGYGTDYSAEQRKLFTIFEGRFQCELTESSRKKLLLLIDNHGIVDTMASLFGTTAAQIDPSMLFLLKMEEHLNAEEE